MITKEIAMKDNKTERKRKSIRLSGDERRRLKKYVGTFPTKIDAADAMGIDRNTIGGVIARGTCSEDTYTLIKNIIDNTAA